ncbi:MAG: hypothetical protein AABW49_01790 [Nanoarchaeota archaeon]
MIFIKNIIEGKPDALAHKHLARYGKGDYERALIKIKKSKNDIKVKTSFDFANDLVGIAAEHASGKINIKGKIIASYDFSSKLNIEHEMIKKGKHYIAELNTDVDDLHEIFNNFKTCSLLLCITADNLKISVGKSLPKPGGRVKDNFCSASLPVRLLSEFAWDVTTDFKELSITHVYHIKELIMPTNTKIELTRDSALRVGTITRRITIDGVISEKDFPLRV